MKKKAWEDSIVAEVRKVKERLASKFDFDIAAMLQDQQKREKNYGSRLVSFEPSFGIKKAKLKNR